MKLNINKKAISKLVATTLTLTTLTGCNFALVDTTYHFDKVMINSGSSSILMNVKAWKDYQGEQLQIITDDNFVMLTSSFDTNCFSENSNDYSASTLSSSLSDEVYDLTTKDTKDIYNKSFFDTRWTFNKAIVFNGDKALVIPIKEWKDYQGEQLQVVTTFGMTLLLSSYNSKLVYDEKSDMKAYDFALMYVGENGIVNDLSDDMGEAKYNYDFIDTKYAFNKVMILKENTSTIMSIDKWTDYEGEQIQISVSGGPKMVTAAYDSVLINDQNSNIKAYEIASLLSDEVYDISNETSKGEFNKQLLDLDYGFSTSIISNKDNASAIKINKWCDYEGEQLQIVLNTGDVILGTSMTLDLLNGGTNDINTSLVAKYYVSENGNYLDEVNNEILDSGYNKTVFDFNNVFKYALKLNGDNVTIIPLKSWKDYENSDSTDYYVDSEGKLKSRTSSGEPNCEQIQLILPDGSAILTTAYNTILVDNKRDITEIAEFFKGSEGVVIDLTPELGEPTASSWNKSFFDTRYTFDSVILANDDKNVVLDIYKWKDFQDGEQVQIIFNDETALLTSYYNATLISSTDSELKNLLSDSFSGKVKVKN